MSYPGYQLSRAFKTPARYSGADVSVVSTPNYADLPTIGTTMDIVLSAEVDDVIFYSLNGLWGASAQEAYMDIATIVGGSAANYAFGAASSGNPGAWGMASVFTAIGAVGWYKLVAGDLASGYVTLRPRAKISSAGSKILYGGGWGFGFFAQNIGPVDPN
jgi:hypothetical protein